MKSPFSRSDDSKLTEEQFRELDTAVFSVFAEMGPLIKAWLDNAKEVKNFVKIPVYEEKEVKSLAFTLVIKKNCCGSEYICPLCQSAKQVDFEGTIKETTE